MSNYIQTIKQVLKEQIENSHSEVLKKYGWKKKDLDYETPTSRFHAFEHPSKHDHIIQLDRKTGNWQHEKHLDIFGKGKTSTDLNDYLKSLKKK